MKKGGARRPRRVVFKVGPLRLTLVGGQIREVVLPDGVQAIQFYGAQLWLREAGKKQYTLRLPGFNCLWSKKERCYFLGAECKDPLYDAVRRFTPPLDQKLRRMLVKRYLMDESDEGWLNLRFYFFLTDEIERVITERYPHRL